MMCERALSRYTHGSLLAEKQTVQNWIADSRAEMHAARLMTLQAAWKMDRSGRAAARVEIAMIKYYGAQVLYNVIDRSLQVHGSLGYSTDLPLEAMYRWARAARIYDGPDEVHRQTVARQTLKDYTASEVPTEFVPTRARGGAREVRRGARAAHRGERRRRSAAGAPSIGGRASKPMARLERRGAAQHEQRRRAGGRRAGGRRAARRR